MIFAIATDEQVLLVFPNEEKAIAYCEGIDVESGNWLFWGEDGLPLQPEFLVSNHHGSFSVGNGIYRLVPAGSGLALAGALPNLRDIELNPLFPSLAAVREHLAAMISVPQDGAQKFV